MGSSPDLLAALWGLYYTQMAQVVASAITPYTPDLLQAKGHQVMNWDSGDISLSDLGTREGYHDLKSRIETRVLALRINWMHQGGMKEPPDMKTLLYGGFMQNGTELATIPYAGSPLPKKQEEEALEHAHSHVTWTGGYSSFKHILASGRNMALPSPLSSISTPPSADAAASAGGLISMGTRRVALSGVKGAVWDVDRLSLSGRHRRRRGLITTPTVDDHSYLHKQYTAGTSSPTPLLPLASAALTSGSSSGSSTVGRHGDADAASGAVAASAVTPLPGDTSAGLELRRGAWGYKQHEDSVGSSRAEGEDQKREEGEWGGVGPPSTLHLVSKTSIAVSDHSDPDTPLSYPPPVAPTTAAAPPTAATPLQHLLQAPDAAPGAAGPGVAPGGGGGGAEGVTRGELGSGVGGVGGGDESKSTLSTSTTSTTFPTTATTRSREGGGGASRGSSASGAAVAGTSAATQHREEQKDIGVPLIQEPTTTSTQSTGYYTISATEPRASTQDHTQGLLQSVSSTFSDQWDYRQTVTTASHGGVVPDLGRPGGASGTGGEGTGVGDGTEGTTAGEGVPTGDEEGEGGGGTGGGRGTGGGGGGGGRDAVGAETEPYDPVTASNVTEVGNVFTVPGVPTTPSTAYKPPSASTSGDSDDATGSTSAGNTNTKRPKPAPSSRSTILVPFHNLSTTSTFQDQTLSKVVTTRKPNVVVTSVVGAATSLPDPEEAGTYDSDGADTSHDDGDATGSDVTAVFPLWDGDVAATSTRLPAFGMESTIECDGIHCYDVYGEVSYNLTTHGEANGSLYGGVGRGGVRRPERVGPEPIHWEILLLLVVVLAGITGNVLVCIAVTIERKLQNVTNYFLMSLAVADLFVSLIVMPCSIVHELMGYWPFGLVMCDIWQVLDVMMCTSSIMHMCTISLDRYIAIRHPLKIRNKSGTVVGIKIATVWFISLAIASPIIMLSLLDSENVLYDETCAIFNHYFLIYGSLGAFFIPLLIMLIAYSLTIHLLNAQAKLCAEKSKSGAPIMRRSTSKRRRSLAPMLHRVGGGGGKRRERSRTPPVAGSERPVSSNGLSIARKIQCRLDRTKAHPSETEPLHKEGSCKSGRHRHNNQDNTDNNSTANSSPTLSRQCSRETGSFPTGKSPRLQALVMKHSAAIKVASVLIAKGKETQNKKTMNTVKTERKAVKVLGTMFAIFVLSWGPFFSLNFAMGVCSSCDIEVALFKVFLWLGYVSSTLNPIIYTIFNKTFKRTFIRILQCKFYTRKLERFSSVNQPNGGSIRVRYDATATTTAMGQNESMV